jgi:alpha-tubulin suppressor-like RCC1 family protein
VFPNHGQCSTTPVAVAGELRFGTIDAGVLLPLNCALTKSGAAYCWGNNELGQLGVGTRAGPEYCPDGYLLTGSFACSTVPAPVAGGFTFTAVTAGRGHACALAASGAAYCWGDNSSGQLGDGTTSTRISPTAVVGGHAFSALAAGYDHTCGVASDGIAYCWGAGGALGGSPTSWIPVPVAGNLTFAAITAGVHYSCALTTEGLAYCWGSNWIGQLGDGTTTNRTAPMPVAGGLVFRAVDAGNDTSCGITAGGIAYCWGGGNTVPVKVPGQP